MIIMINLSGKNVKMHAHLIVVTSPEIDHNMLVPATIIVSTRLATALAGYVPVEEHDSAGIVKLIHLKPKMLFSLSTVFCRSMEKRPEKKEGVAEVNVEKLCLSHAPC